MAEEARLPGFEPGLGMPELELGAGRREAPGRGIPVVVGRAIRDEALGGRIPLWYRMGCRTPLELPVELCKRNIWSKTSQRRQKCP